MRRVHDVAAAELPSVELAHGWRLHGLDPVLLEQAGAILHEPAAAIPAALAGRLGALRVFAVPFIACGGESEFVAVEPPSGELHSSLWIEQPQGTALFLSLRETNAHDTGFELLAAVADLAVPRLTDQEFAAYARLLDREQREGAQGEIDDDALEAKNAADPGYAAASLAATLAEYMHALWHDVEVRMGQPHLDPKFLRRRFELLERWFPPNPGDRLFREG